jgi:translation initiation factor IF-2
MMTTTGLKKGRSRNVPIRIYAFAKELELDNKQLLDICEKAGIKGKGSALASLDDDEVSSIKEFMSGAGNVATAPPADEKPAPMRPPERRSLDTKVPVIKTPKPVVPPPVEEPTPVEEAPSEPVAEESAPTEATEAAKPTESEPEQPAKGNRVTTAVGGLLDRLRGGTKKASDKAIEEAESKKRSANAPIPKTPLAPRRDTSNRGSGMRNLDQRPARKDGDEPKKPAKKRGVNINIAPLPEVDQSALHKAPKEKVQKPDIALPQDARKQIAAGGTAPLEQFTNAKKKDKKKLGRGETAGTEEDASKTRRKGRPSGSTADSPLGGLRQNRNRRPHRSNYRSRRTHRRGPAVNTAAPRKDSVVLQLPCTVREFSEAAGVTAIEALLTIKKLGEEANLTINSVLDDDTVELLVEHFQVQVEIREQVTLEDQLLDKFESIDEDETLLAPRAPIVTFLGHVDHGKTSLLDALIGIDVVSGEAGGITQHIRAYEIKKGDNKIAFVDTPGHEAFTEMRARGANVTDIAVLVVAADDGVMPQTAEAITHAKAAGVPIIVALNKIDLPGITADKAMQDLATAELLPSEWGGDTEVIKTSAIAGTGLDELLETILVTAELHEYKANFDRPANGTCLESEQQSDRGVVCKVIVQGGTLKVGDVVVCGPAYGRVKAMHDTLKSKKRLKTAGPSTPVNVTGFNTAPGAGDKLYVVDDIAKAREIAESRLHVAHSSNVAGTVKVSLEEMMRRLESGNLKASDHEVVTLNLILRADTKGSIEAIKKELGKIEHPEVRIKLVQALVGGVTVADVRLAQASEAVICAFNVVPNEDARSLADEVGAEIRRYEVIYKITDDLKATLEGRLKPEEKVVEQGMAMILRTFTVSKTGTIAGCRVMRGSIQRECRMRVIRDSTVIGDYAIESLKREKDDSKEVQRGMECGIKLAGFNDVKEGDTLEAYRIEEIARTL